MAKTFNDYIKEVYDEIKLKKVSKKMPFCSMCGHKHEAEKSLSPVKQPEMPNFCIKCGEPITLGDK